MLTPSEFLHSLQGSSLGRDFYRPLDDLLPEHGGSRFKKLCLGLTVLRLVENFLEAVLSSKGCAVPPPSLAAYKSLQRLSNKADSVLLATSYPRKMRNQHEGRASRWNMICAAGDCLGISVQCRSIAISSYLTDQEMAGTTEDAGMQRLQGMDAEPGGHLWHAVLISLPPYLCGAGSSISSCVRSFLVRQVA